MDDHEEPITDQELAGYAKGKFLLRILGLRTEYYRLLLDTNGRNALAASALARRLAPDAPELPNRIRESVLRIGSYQIWGEVQRSEKTFDRAVAFVLFMTLVPALLGAIFYAEGSIWRRILYAVVAGVTCFGISFTGLGVSGFRVPTSRTVRAVCGLLALGGLMTAGWWLWHWETIWGLGLSAGIFTAVFSLFALGTLYQIGYALIQAAFHVSWTRWTAAELVETLAATHWRLLNEPEPACLLAATDNLIHVAVCVERFLPPYLTGYASSMVKASLMQLAPREFAEIAAPVRILARECLLPKASTRTEVAAKVEHLLITAAQERWGEWERSRAEEVERAARWWAWISGALRFALALLPLLLVALGAFYVYQANPASPLLKAEVLAPVLVATLGFFATVLNPSSEREKPGRRRKPFGSRKIGT